MWSTETSLKERIGMRRAKEAEDIVNYPRETLGIFLLGKVVEAETGISI